MLEKGLDLADHSGPQVVQRPDVLVGAGQGRDPDKTIVARSFPVLLVLLRLDGADQPRRDDAARKGRRIHEHEYVERIAIPAPGRGYEPEIEWKRDPLGQHRLEPKYAQFLVVIELVAAALWGFDNRQDRRAALREGRETTIRFDPAVQGPTSGCFAFAQELAATESSAPSSAELFAASNVANRHPRRVIDAALAKSNLDRSPRRKCR